MSCYTVLKYMAVSFVRILLVWFKKVTLNHWAKPWFTCRVVNNDNHEQTRIIMNRTCNTTIIILRITLSTKTKAIQCGCNNITCMVSLMVSYLAIA